MESNERKHKYNKIYRIEIYNIEHSFVNVSLTVMRLFESSNDTIAGLKLVAKRADEEETITTIITAFKTVW